MLLKLQCIFKSAFVVQQKYSVLECYIYAQPHLCNSYKLVIMKYFPQKSLSQPMYFLNEVGSDIIHYFLVPYLLPSWSQKPVLQSQVLTECEPILIQHQLLQAIGFLLVIFLVKCVLILARLVGSLHQLSCVSTSSSVMTAKNRHHNT